MKWIDIKDRKPKKMRTILMFRKGLDLEIGYYVQSIDMFFKYKNSRGNRFSLTHWTYVNQPKETK